MSRSIRSRAHDCGGDGREFTITTHLTKWESNTARQVRATLATRCGERVVTPGRKNCLFIGAPEEEQRCKVGGLCVLMGRGWGAAGNVLYSSSNTTSNPTVTL